MHVMWCKCVHVTDCVGVRSGNNEVQGALYKRDF